MNTVETFSRERSFFFAPFRSALDSTFHLVRASAIVHQLKVHRMGALHPDRMSAAERLDEVAEILAAGLTRLRARQSSALPADFGESSLHCAGDQSGHANVLKGELG